jgi:phosphoribosylaminoimidazole-succinocarboxamide synthase
MLVRATRPVRLECIARGYLFGSAWSEYGERGTVCGRALPTGLQQADRLPDPIFTSSTKAEAGHDLPLTDAEAAELVGDAVFEQVRDATLALYRFAADHAGGCGLLLADTKFEFGTVDDELLLIDEILTPDSSRYWPAEHYRVGTSPPSFDKQYVRDYYLGLGWNQEPPAPPLPRDVVAGTRARYIEAYELLTDRDFGDWHTSE